MVDQGDMDDASFVGGHRFHGKRLTAGNHGLRHVLGQGLQCLVAALLIAIDINNYKWRSFNLVGDYKPDNILKAGQCLTPSPYQQPQFLTLYIKNNRRLFSLAFLNDGLGPVLRRGSHSHTGQDCLQDVFNCAGDISRLGRFGSRLGSYYNPGLLSPDAQDATSTFA